MIVKILTRHNPSYGTLVDYMIREGKGRDGKPIVFTHNFKGTTRDQWLQEFKENEAFRQHVRKDQIYLYHEIISLSNKENKDLITQNILQDLAEQYINFRGKEGMYIASFHEDKEHSHIHFAVSGVKYRTGMAHRLTHETLHDLKVNFQNYHKDKYPFLSFSNPEHGKGKEYMKDKEYFIKNKRTDVKTAIREQIQSLFNEAKSQQHFLQLLQENNLNHYERNGLPNGIVHENLKFRFSNLDIPFKEMPVDVELQSEEQQVLNEIRELRESRSERDRGDKDIYIFVLLFSN